MCYGKSDGAPYDIIQRDRKLEYVPFESRNKCDSFSILVNKLSAEKLEKAKSVHGWDYVNEGIVTKKLKKS